MNKILFIFLFSISCYSQAKYDQIKKADKFETYQLENGLIIKVGDTIKFGLPSTANQFVYVTQGNVGTSTIIANKKHPITKLVSIGSEKNGFKMYAVIKNYGLIPVYIDIDNAFETKEIKNFIITPQ
jgi:hypothetical protein